MSHKQHVTKSRPITQPKFIHPPTHHKESLSVTDGSSKMVNSKELILYNDDVNGVDGSPPLHVRRANSA